MTVKQYVKKVNEIIIADFIEEDIIIFIIVNYFLNKKRGNKKLILNTLFITN